MLEIITGRAAWWVAGGLALLLAASGCLLRAAYIERGELIASQDALRRAMDQQRAEADRARKERDIVVELSAQRAEQQAAMQAQLETARATLRVLRRENAQVAALDDCRVPPAAVQWMRAAAGSGDADAGDGAAVGVAPADASAEPKH